MRAGPNECESRLASGRALDLEAHFLDHSPRLLGRLARRRQVALHEDRVRRIQGERLPLTEISLASPGGTNLRCRVREAKHTERLERAHRSEKVGALERRAIDGVEEVDWQRVDLEV